MRRRSTLSKEALASRLAALQRRFIDQLPDRMQRLREALCPPAGKEACLSTARALTHGLSGSGGTFGFPEISDAARALSNALQSHAEHHPPKAVQPLLEALQAAVSEALRQGDTTPQPLIERKASAPADAALPVCLISADQALAGELRLKLGHFGYAVRAFDTVAAALEHADEDSPLALIVDSDFSDDEKAGVQALAEHPFPAPRKPPLVFISARDDFEARLAGVRNGGQAYFTRPVEIPALAATLDTLTERIPPMPPRVLIIEDDENVSRFYAETLDASGIVPTCLTDPTRLAQALSESRPDLILMDLYLPGCDGIELASLIRQQDAYVSVPIVFLSSETAEEQQLLALKSGADDYLTKPVDPTRLVSVICSRARRAGVLREHIDHDSLTGLLNHGRLEERLELELLRSKRLGHPLAFAMIDLDHFKSVNDSHGHAAGDQVLRALARLLQSRLRRTDVAGRYGGEEFALILTDTDGASAQRILEPLRKEFAALSHTADGASFHVTFSCGIADFPTHPDASSLTAAADDALYDAKERGRNRIELAPSPHARPAA
ncbi:diguanylate cyclase [Parazoarcus communis]|uniref:diguanylate cyclase n=1 Tax=Parazoarcus communis TaxID=41977 RepID=A0A2U8GWA4_9RHOO|nr:diguanylate cyclase [Parazoarcus communis]